MPRFAANLTLMFTEWPFLDRFAAAADAGFEAAEFLFPYDHPPEAVGRAVRASGLVPALLNAPPGRGGEKGLAALPDRFDEFRASIETALVYAGATGTERVHVMAGLHDRRDPEAWTAFRRSVGWAADRFAASGIELMLEPINGRDMPGYFLGDFGEAERFIRELGHPGVRLQFDLYHRQILHGDVARALGAAMPLVGHMQVASVPSRHEPDDEELNCPFLFGEIDRLGYAGFVGCEYRPRAGTLAGLRWFEPYRKA